MKQPWWAVALVALVAVGLGVGSAFLVDGGSDAAPAATSTTIAATATTEATVPSTEATETTERPDTTTTTSAPTTTAPTTTAPSTTESPTTTEVAQPPLEEIGIVVANGSAASGIAARTAELLRAAGYPNVQTANGADIVAETVMYVADGLEPTAQAIVADLEAADTDFVAPTSFLPLPEAPALIPERPDADIILYLGRDQEPDA